MDLPDFRVWRWHASARQQPHIAGSVLHQIVPERRVGFESYYKIALMPWLLLTPDIQVVGPSQEQEGTSLVGRKSVGLATILGVRLQTIF